MATLTVNLDLIRKNIEEIKSNLSPKTKFCLVVKSNAYGLGAREIVRQFAGLVDCFAVSCKSEFLQAKRITTKSILLLDPVYENITKLARQNAVFCVSNFESLQKILNSAKRNKTLNFCVQIAINTGMNRFGFKKKSDIILAIQKIKKVQNISIFGVFSHYFASLSENFVKIQFLKFKEVKQIFDENFENFKPVFSIAASSAVWQKNHFDMVRVGLAAFSDGRFETVKLVAKILDFQDLKRGESAGYDACFVAEKDTKIAVVSIGYGDGIFRKLAGRGYCLINDKFCKIVAVCMDSILVDITGVCCKIYDDAILIGKDKDNQIFTCDLAEWCDTIEYEILTHISARVKRKYVGGQSHANYYWKISSEKTCAG